MSDDTSTVIAALPVEDAALTERIEKVSQGVDEAQRLRIHMPNGTAAGCELHIGDVRLGMVSAVSLDVAAGQVAKAALMFVLPSVDVSLPVEDVSVHLPLPGGGLNVPLASLLRWQKEGVPA